MRPVEGPTAASSDASERGAGWALPVVGAVIRGGPALGLGRSWRTLFGKSAGLLLPG